ncbi:MAG: flagellar biosynthesis protein FliW [Nautilia sp.]|nr:MAG: flagellar biosynthesis protein FliW [Nautilia sp.]
MIYEVKKPILGFENVKRVELLDIDKAFSMLTPLEHKIPGFTLINPYVLKEYSFDIPSDVKALLDISPNSNLLVYNIVVLHNPITKSIVNFKAPLLFNKDNKTMAQFIIDEPYMSIEEALALKEKQEKIQAMV